MNSLKHVAIIMDGNGRWAQLRGRPRNYGHVKGVRIAKKIIKHASEVGIPYLTLYAFSTENWYRPEDEVSVLMQLLEKYLRKETKNLHKDNIRFDTIGDLSRIPKHICDLISEAKQKTQNNTGLQVNFAISYGSRQEILNTVKKIALDITQNKMNASDITEETISKNLMTASCPDPDLIIRTSGESRLSNFLMWQASYSELYFTDVLWPDFNEAEFDAALANFNNRNRRFGKIDLGANEPKQSHKDLFKNDELNI